jgi:hypothetical protein
MALKKRAASEGKNVHVAKGGIGRVDQIGVTSVELAGRLLKTLAGPQN